MPRTVLIAAGGTGGHLFPAEALASVLAERGWVVHLATDHRAEGYGVEFPAAETHIIPSGTLAGSAFNRLDAFIQLAQGFVRSVLLLNRIGANVAVGFGGYPTLPPMLAAWFAGYPTVIHEANAVLGRANRLLAARVTAIAATTNELKLSERDRQKIAITGNPVREAVRAAAALPLPPLGPNEVFRLLVFGGSQGARFLSDLMPPAIEDLDPETRRRLHVVQQCRAEDIDRVRADYERLGVKVELAPFFRDLPAKMATSHLVISRSGASTVAELAVIGRPAILIPLPGALDDDQGANARMMQAAGGGWPLPQPDLTPEKLARELRRLIAAPEGLAKAAEAARSIGRADAAERLADLVERTALATKRKRIP
jgi:UDP-N-acetylglucosamine--N-acetylmuramyl-(pentapeptide) pyrophosphoryl-undecaprenol N-acetylglucosamine transferase